MTRELTFQTIKNSGSLNSASFTERQADLLYLFLFKNKILDKTISMFQDEDGKIYFHERGPLHVFKGGHYTRMYFLDNFLESRVKLFNRYKLKNTRLKNFLEVLSENIKDLKSKKTD